MDIIGTSGSENVNASCYLNSNIGEAIVYTYQTTSNILTQGFEQPENTYMMSIANDNISNWNTKFYPNPTTGKLSISIKDMKEIIVYVKEINGKNLDINVNKDEKNGSYSCDLSSLDQGIYLIILVDILSNKAPLVIRVIKI